MKIDFKNKITEELQGTNFFDNLPAEIHDFTFRKVFEEDLDKFIYFSYENIKTHRGLTAYFHEETQEYKVKVNIGFNEFCLTEFFSENLTDYCKKISDKLENFLENFSKGQSKLNPLMRSKRFLEWNYGKNLPENIAGFELFISPKNPVEFTNGSCIVINYSDFETESDFTIFYNIYTRDFSTEYTEKHVPHISYLFDSENLKELEQKLSQNLSAELSRIRKNLQ
ncbi:MAG: hypothetical protein IK062_02640 [Selenomonadaceae bacterium]|nr:hypothetical protein [Selenomonadaceae bacterium]